ncbi:hypothetical protein Bbelb_261730 [Branchiostoma belcheri]|nr:hypothetical protein Bbelb_261730 [Branchiostoma belcheri]
MSHPYERSPDVDSAALEPKPMAAMCQHYTAKLSSHGLPRRLEIPAMTSPQQGASLELNCCTTRPAPQTHLLYHDVPGVTLVISRTTITRTCEIANPGFRLILGPTQASSSAQGPRENFASAPLRVAWFGSVRLQLTRCYPRATVHIASGRVIYTARTSTGRTARNTGLKCADNPQNA